MLSLMVCYFYRPFPHEISRMRSGIELSQLLRIFLPTLMTLCLYSTVKILKIGTPEIITIIFLQLEQLDFTVQYCVQKMQTE